MNNSQDYICYKCNVNTTNSVKKFYNQEISLIKNILYDKYIYIKDLENKIEEYLYHINGHLIIHSVKYRNEVMNEYKKVCTKCFQIGIYISLERQNRLPFLRYDIRYFLSYFDTHGLSEEDINDLDNNANTMKLKFKNYIFPLYYNCSFYRQSVPKLVDNSYIIESI
jgi:hypothetical protein